MALTVTPIKKFDIGDGQMIVADILFDGSYPTGGETIQEIKDVFRAGIVQHVSGSGQGRVVSFDASGELLLVHQAGTADAVLNEVGNAVDLSGLTVRCMIIGR